MIDNLMFWNSKDFVERKVMQAFTICSKIIKFYVYSQKEINIIIFFFDEDELFLYIESYQRDNAVK